MNRSEMVRQMEKEMERFAAECEAVYNAANNLSRRDMRALRKRARAMGIGPQDTHRLVTREDWENYIPIRRWKQNDSETLACVGVWHVLTFWRYRRWKHVVTMLTPVGWPVRLSWCWW